MINRVLSFLFAFASFAGLASAQVPYRCTASSSAQSLRPEGVAEYVADVVVVCTGGSPSSSSPQPVTITLNANITSRLDANNTSEATLLINEPVSDSRSVGSNTFRGVQSSPNSIRFDIVSVFQPGSGTQTYRFTNIRVDASQLAAGAIVQALVSTSGGTGTIPANQVIAGAVQSKQTFDVRTCDDSGSTFVNFLQANSQNANLITGSATTGRIAFNVRFQGGFTGGYRKAIDPNQDGSDAGIQYNSESDLVDTLVLGPAGIATQGTRLLSRFNNIPAGVRLFVTTRPLAPGAASSTTLVANLISADANGAGSSNPLAASGTGTCQASGATQFIVEIPVVNGSAQAVWEVTDSSTTAVEKASFGVVVAYAAPPSSPVLGTASVTGRLGPVSTIATASASAPAPRFGTATATIPAFAINAVNPSPIVITTASPLPPGQAGVPYSLPSFAATGGNPATFSWSATQGSVLPPGLVLLANGSFSGTPTTAGTYSFTIQVTDQFNGFASSPFTITIAAASAPMITTASPLPSGQVAIPYPPLQFTQTGNPIPIVWSILTGTLPPGLTFSNTGVLSGTPTAQGTYNFTVQARQASKAFTITINPNSPITIAPSVLPGGPVGTPYSQLLTASGGTGPYTFTLSAGTLPSGLTLASSGLISGTLLSQGTSTFVIVAADSLGRTGSQGYNVAAVTVIPPDTSLNDLTITTRTIPNGNVGTDYAATLAARGGVTPYTWSVDPKTLPPGLTLSSGGVFSGKPTRAGLYGVSVKVTDARGSSDGAVFFMTVTGPPLSITTTTLGNGTVGLSYSGSVAATGGIPPYAFSVIAGSLPAGLSLAADGTISGTPTAAGSSSFTVQVTDTAQNPQGAATRLLTITVLANPPAITTTALSNGVVNVAYSGSVTASGGVPPYTFSIASGSLPNGLSLGSGGDITGTPTTLGDFSVTIQVTDKQRQTASKAFAVKIVAPPQITTNSPLGILVTGTASQLTLAATGGTLPYAWSVTSGSLPAGVSLDAVTGAINGTPTAAGPYSFTATVTDASKLTAAKAFTGRVTTPVRITTASPLPDAIVGVAYSQQINAAGGTVPYRFSGDSLPAGLSISQSGLITGTPTAATPGVFNVTAIDSDSLTVAGRFTIAVSLPQVSGVTIGGVTDTASPQQQPKVTLTLGSAFPVNITGTVVLSFASDANVPADDPAIQFSTGGRAAIFTIPAGSTTGTFTDPNIAIQTGTVSGTITLTTALQAAGGAVSCNCALTRTIRVAKGVPVISTVRAANASGAITITVIGFSTTRELTQATFQFTTAAGANVQSTSFTVPVSTFFTTWYTSAQSGAFGSQFLLTQPFTISGNQNAVTNVSVTLTNSVGTSTAVSAPVQ